ncbi:MAG: hypothetical protein PsegKO_16730 [Pseudohongiellaceae bacterium]
MAASATTTPVTSKPQASSPLPATCPQAQASSARQLLDNRLQALITRPGNATVRATLALLQLANFYEIRHWVGRNQARLLLADSERALLQALPAGAMLCRCSNYEFAVLLENDHSEQACVIAKQLKAALQSAVSRALPPQIQLQCAAGLATLGKHVRLPEVLFARARHSLSRNTPLPALDEQQSLITARAILGGLRAKQLRLTFQPLVPLRAGEASGSDNSCGSYEVRSHLHTTRGRLSGQRLFSAAVDNALGESLDRWVVRASLARLQQREFTGAVLIVNLSLTSLVSDRFVTWLDQLLHSVPHPGTRLVLQISELDLLVAQHHLRDFSIAMKALGIPLAITHFGCSQDPQRYLSLLRITQIKLDSSLLSNLAPDSSQLQSLTSLVSALHERQITVATGQLEDLHLLPLLWQAGLDLVQGNLLQPPASVPSMDCVSNLGNL